MDDRVRTGNSLVTYESWEFNTNYDQVNMNPRKVIFVQDDKYKDNPLSLNTLQKSFDTSMDELIEVQGHPCLLCLEPFF